MIKKMIAFLRPFRRKGSLRGMSYGELRKLYYQLDELGNVNRDAMKRVKDAMDRIVDDALKNAPWGEGEVA